MWHLKVNQYQTYVDLIKSLCLDCAVDSCGTDNFMQDAHNRCQVVTHEGEIWLYVKFNVFAAYSWYCYDFVSFPSKRYSICPPTGQATSHYLNQWWLVYWHIYASLGFSELRCYLTRRWFKQWHIYIYICLSHTTILIPFMKQLTS